MKLSDWAIDYQALVAGATTTQEKRDSLGNGVLEQSVRIYKMLVKRPVCLDEIPCGSFFYGLDYYSFLELKEAVPLNDTIDDRVLFAIGSSAPAQDKKDARVRLRGLIGATEKRFGPQFDKGHFIARSIGGGTEVNIFPQRRDLNRGWSVQGQLFRMMEEYCHIHPGTLCFNRPDAEKPKPVPPRWQDAKQGAADLLIELPNPAEGTPVYIATDGVDHGTLVRLRAFVRAAERSGQKMKLL